jgi:transcriptional regulator of NAD metabolism
MSNDNQLNQFYKNIDSDIRTMIAAGYTLSNIYIYYKDYVSLEDVIRIHDEETVQWSWKLLLNS